MDEHAVQPVYLLCRLGVMHNEYKNFVHIGGCGGGGICELICLLCLSVFHYSMCCRLHLS